MVDVRTEVFDELFAPFEIDTEEIRLHWRLYIRGSKQGFDVYKTTKRGWQVMKVNMDTYSIFVPTKREKERAIAFCRKIIGKL